MPTATQTKPKTPDVDAATEQLRDFNEQALDFSRKTGAQIIDAYATNMGVLADLQEKVADAADVEWLGKASRAQAKFTREITTIHVDAARAALK
jgi:hypothetical protein